MPAAKRATTLQARTPPRPATKKPAPVKQIRGPNETRRLSTRAKLINATIDCLFELGYYRTSTVLVTERAGVSRGSLLHQFPSKADLMVAVSEHIAIERARAHRDGLAGTSEGIDRIGNVIDILWGQLSSPTGVARLEIMLASRSDPELAEKFAPLNARLDRSHKDLVWTLAKRLGVKDRAPVDGMVQLYTATLRGLSVDALFKEYPRTHVAKAVELLKQTQTELLRKLIADAK